MQTRSAGAPAQDIETRAAVSALQTAWTEFRSANDARLAEIEKRGSSDVIVTEKVDRINAAITDVRTRMDELELRAKRAGAPGSEAEGSDPEAREYRTDWLRYMRRGDISDRLEKRAMSEGNNVEGGYLTAPDVDREIAKLARDASPVRQVATVRQIGSGMYKRPVSKSNNTSGWVGEQDSRPQTNPADLAEIAISTQELYANVYATQTILDDAYINLEQFIAEETFAEFDKQEGDAFINGNGVNKPRGLLSLPTTVETGAADAAQGRLGLVKSGVNGGWATPSATASPADCLIDLIGRLRPIYRANARFMMNRFTEAAVRKFKDTTGQYIWQPGTALGVPATLLGFSNAIADHMPDVANDAIPILFGDFRRAYTIVDRIGVRTLRDPYSAKPYVLFYVTKRVGGGVVISQAYKGLQSKA